jgi:hypothetical protein
MGWRYPDFVHKLLELGVTICPTTGTMESVVTNVAAEVEFRELDIASLVGGVSCLLSPSTASR